MTATWAEVERAVSGRRAGPPKHAAGSTLAVPTTRFRASSVGVRRIGASEHQVLRPASTGGQPAPPEWKRPAARRISVVQHASRFCCADERSLDCVRHNTVIVAYHLDKCAIVIEAHFQPEEKRQSTKRQSAVNVLLALTLCEIDYLVLDELV